MIARDFDETIIAKVKSLLEAQSNISFKAGLKQGRKEVVESVVRSGLLPQHHSLCYGTDIESHPDCLCCKWLQNLKEWENIDGD